MTNAANRWVKGALLAQKREMGGECQHRGCGEHRLSRLEFAHTTPTEISGTGPRGRKEKLADVHKHPNSYRLLCKKHHTKESHNLHSRQTREGIKRSKNPYPIQAQKRQSEFDILNFNYSKLFKGRRW